MSRRVAALPTTADGVPFARKTWSLLVAATAAAEERAGGRALAAYPVFRETAGPAWTDDVRERRRRCADALRDAVEELCARMGREDVVQPGDHAVAVAKQFLPLFTSAAPPVFGGVYAAAPEFACAAHLMYHVLVLAGGGDVSMWRIRFALVPPDVASGPPLEDVVRKAIARHVRERGRAPATVVVAVDMPPAVVEVGPRSYRLTCAPGELPGTVAIDVEEMGL